MKTLIILSIWLLPITQTPKEYNMMCFSGSNSTYFYIIKGQNAYYYNFLNHTVELKDLKTMFWKKSNKFPIDTVWFKLESNIKINETQVSDKLNAELNKNQ